MNVHPIQMPDAGLKVLNHFAQIGQQTLVQLERQIPDLERGGLTAFGNFHAGVCHVQALRQNLWKDGPGIRLEVEVVRPRVVVLEVF